MDNVNIQETMFNLISLLDQKFVRPMDQQFRTIISPLQVDVLALLTKKDATMTELSNKMFISKQQMTPIINKLVTKNLVQRTYVNDDRRLIRISITPAGLQLLENIKENALKIIADKLMNLDDNDKLCLSQTLADLHRIIHKIS